MKVNRSRSRISLLPASTVSALLLLAACAGDGDGGVGEADLALGTCSLSGAGADAACSEGSVSIATAGPGAPPPLVQVARSYGLRLVADSATGKNSGAIRFVAPTDGDYVVYIGTPNMPMAISEGGVAVEPGCSTRLYADDCPLMRRAFGVSLDAGIEYRFDFGPIAPQRWVRWRIEPRRTAPLVVAATLAGEASSDLYTIDASGAGFARVVSSSDNETLPRWSPDGSKLAYVVDRQLLVADADGSGGAVVAPVVGRAPFTVNAAAWSPDGQRLAYTYPRDPFVIGDEDETIDQSYETTLHIVGADGSGDVAYAEPFVHQFPPGMGTLYEPAWSSQGVLAYLNDDDCPDCAGGGEISISQGDGSQYRRLEVDAGSPVVHDLDWSPDGSQVVFRRRGAGSTQILTRATLATTSDPAVVRLVTTDLGIVGGNPVWSPDGGSIAYVGADGVYVVAATAGAVPRRVLAATDIRGLDW